MFKEIMPPNLLQDKNIKALIEAIDPEFEKVKNEIINVLIYPRIDELDAEVLDLLAYQFHLEGYDLARSVEEKRNLVKKAIQLHRYKGTKYAIKEVLKALNLEGQVKEWFEYGGQPYKFKVEIDLLNKGLSKETLNKFEDLVNQYKNERSWLEELIVYLTTKNKNPVIGATALSGEYVTIYPYYISELSQSSTVPSCSAGMVSGDVTTIYPLEV